MFRLFVVILCFGLFPINSVFANTNSEQLVRPRAAIGLGVGVAGLVHVDYQRWIMNNTSFEVGLTPLLLHNVVAATMTQHFSIESSDLSDTNIVLSGMWLHIINMGYIAGGPGVRIGVEKLYRDFGMSLAGGPALDVLDGFNGNVEYDVRFTFWFIRRNSIGNGTH